MSTGRPGSGSTPPRWQTSAPAGGAARTPDSYGVGLSQQPPSQPPYSQPSASQTPFAQTAGGFQSMTPLQPGVVLNNTHRIDQMLGRGGMGEVYRGTNVHTNDQVAIKVIRPELVDDGQMRDLFLREAMALRKIRHPAVVSYEGASADASGRLYLVMDFVEGPSLGQMVTQRPLTPTQVRALRRRLAEGLQAAHDQNVVHRDLSPDNIILRGGDLSQATIIDFGIARRTDSAKSSVIGKAFAGKVEYAAPEQFGMFTGVADARSDIYTLGLVLAAAALGHPLDMGSSAMTAIESRKKVPNLSRVPAELRPGLARMLEPEPANRPPSMREVAALDALDSGRGGAGRGLRIALLAGGLGLVAAVGAAFAFADPIGMIRSIFDSGVSAEEAEAWRKATQADTAAGYKGFLDRFPNSRYAAEAREKQAAAVQREATAREDEAWRRAVQTDTAVGYQAYLTRYPNGRYVAEARQRLAVAQQREAQGREEEQAWQRARQTDTVAGYDTFLRQFPNGKHVAEARQRQAAARQRDAGSGDEEEQLWRRAASATTAEPIQEYLRRYPAGRYADAARRKLADIMSSERKPGVVGNFSPVSCASVPLRIPPGFTCQVSNDFTVPGGVRARVYLVVGAVGGSETNIQLFQVVGDGSLIITVPAQQALPQINAFAQAGRDWSGVLSYGGAEFMTFRSGALNCVAVRKPGTPRGSGSGVANLFLAIQCAPQGQPLYPNDIRALIDDLRVK
jgi:outer membrane protein assembly factor BamD (BamD/ComL family)